MVSVTRMQIMPQPFGELLNSWFRTIGRNWKTLVATSLLVQVPISLVFLITFWVTGSAGDLAELINSDLDLVQSDQLEAALQPLMGTVSVWFLLLFPATVFIHLAAVRIVADDWSGSPSTTGEASSAALRRTATGVAWAIIVLFAATLLIGVAVAVGWLVITSAGTNFLTVFVTMVAALTVFVVLVWLSVSISLGLPAIAVEGSGPIAALPRSHSLVKGRWWVTLGFLALVGIIASAASQVLSLVLIPVYVAGIFVPEAFALAFVIAVVLQAPFTAAAAAGYAVWYIDLRARQESLLTEHLAR
jgi:hypothetical protein